MRWDSKRIRHLVASQIAGVNPAFFSVNAEAQYDSWLTVGMTGGEAPTALSIIGEDIKAWSEDKGLVTSDGAVFWMNPKDGPSASDTNGAQGKGSPTGNVVIAQLTVKTGTTFDAQVQMRTAPTWSCAFCVANTHVLLPPGQLPGAAPG